MLWLFAQVVPVSTTDLVNSVLQLGLPSALLLYFIWEGKRREERISKEGVEREQKLSTRIETLEAFIRTELLDMTKQVVGALRKDTDATTRQMEMIDNLNELISEKLNHKNDRHSTT
jgi:hypothetical protein